MKRKHPAASPEDTAPDSMDELAKAPTETVVVEERSWFTGCSWFFLLGLAVVAALVFAGVWGVRQVMQRSYVRDLDTHFQDVSLLPTRMLKPLQPEMQIQLYFIVRGQALAVQTRRLTHTAGAIERVHLIAQELANPPATGLFESPLPKGTVIRGVFIHEGIVWIDLSGEFLAAGKQSGIASPHRERLAIYALVNSFMLNDQSLQGVQVLVEGKPISSAWGWLDLSSPLGPDLSLIR